MDGLKMMEWSERYWGMMSHESRTRIRGMMIEAKDDQAVIEVFQGQEFTQLVLGFAILGMAHCHVPRSQIHEPSLC